LFCFGSWVININSDNSYAADRFVWFMWSRYAD
jgi:hypothetical protein